MFEILPKDQPQFHGAVLSNLYISQKQNLYRDNFDARRFNIDGKDHSGSFDVKKHVYYLNWYFQNLPSIYQAYAMLADELSKRLYLHLILYRLVGHLHVKIPSAYDRAQERKAQFKDGLPWTPSSYPLSGAFGGLRHYDINIGSRHYEADCLGLEAILIAGQYFFERDGVRVQPESGDYVIDGGACLGEATLAFCHAVGEHGRVYSFDPVRENIDVFNYNLQYHPWKNARLFPFGLSNQTVSGEPISVGTYAPGFNVDAQTPVGTIDDLVFNAKEIPRVDFIKLDIEGSELRCLVGAERTIREFRPRMAISLYHKPNDIFSLMTHIQGTFGFYDFHIDHYTIHMEETVLYCKPRTAQAA